ncbi:tetratricopeptide repeat protein, partial [Desulfobacterales bacterium HSG2]|nr:tetratricopeptide repeat protein [Desulfobacterales bacterium HSG2]
YRSKGDYGKAEPLYRQASEIWGRVLGKDHPDYATSLNNLAELYKSKGEYGKAEPLYLQAAEIIERVLGKDHPDYAASLSGLAALYVSTGDYRKAEPLYLQAAEIRERVLGKDHPDYATSLNNLAELYKTKGEYEKAEPLHLQAAEITERVLGKDHPSYATSLGNLASLYQSTGEYGKAEPLHRQASEIWERVLGKDHPSYATSLNNLAGLYYSTGDYGKAEPLYLQALKIRKRVSGKDHPDYAISLDNLALLYRSMGEYGKAEPLFLKATEIEEKVLGKDHPDYATSLGNLAALYQSTGEYGKAEPLYLQALKIRERVLGKDHPRFAVSLNHLAELEIRTGRSGDALEKMLEASGIDDRMILRMFSVGDEKRIQEYIRTFQDNYFLLLSNFSQHCSELKEYTPSVLDVVFRRKALGLELTAIRRDNILSDNNPELKAGFDELRHTRIAISRVITEGPGETSPKKYQKKIHALEQKIETLERELAAQVPQIEVQKKLENAGHRAIADLLPEDTHLIEFVWYKPCDFEQMEYLPPRYLVFILSSDPEEDIQMADLGDASETDTLIERYKKEIIEDTRGLGAPSHREKPVIRDTIIVPHPLYEKLFRPLLKHIGETKKLMISTDGNITLLPFEILVQPDGRYVIEDYEISYLDSGRDLIRYQHRETPRSKGLILADPDFDLAGSGTSPGTAAVRGRRSYELEKMISDRSADRPESPLHFTPLPGTKVEGETIKNLLTQNSDIWMKENVLEQKVKQIQGPQILHIATHGFFMPGHEEDEPELLRKSGFTGSFGDQGMFLGKRFENPLLRSALALAGANTFTQEKSPADGAEDGLLTALDVTGMNLIGTELVVLSACETGLGEVQTGEGIYGLRRAFTLAGAVTQIVSLWKVPDNETQELMVNFYNRVLQGKGKAEALRESQREMIRKLRDEGKPTSPFLWGAFVCVGNWRPMEELTDKELILKEQPDESVYSEAEDEDEYEDEDEDEDDLSNPSLIEFFAEMTAEKLNLCGECGGSEIRKGPAYMSLAVLIGCLAGLIALPFYHGLWWLIVSVPLGIVLLMFLLVAADVLLPFVKCPECGRQFIPVKTGDKN